MKKNVDSSSLDRFRELPDFPAFEAFSHALWNNEAAAMVGAGFSRACNREKDSPIPPLWRDYKKQMAMALGSDHTDGLDALRLAQEYKTLHGDSGLDQLIHRTVADDQWEPGFLHQQLLELPWRDILTTNWDTLLERTKPKTPDRIYSCVRTTQDIAHRRPPRIVKLHGSLPSHKPFIFTEDDYRTYPAKFAPFVNLAQQVMLEHDLCLIGFSGTDPNFLAWSGWVRDTLAISARRIRLVGVLDLSPGSRALLQERNVTPIDLAPLVSHVHKDEQYVEALKLFFSALFAAEPPSPFTWNTCSEVLTSGNSSSRIAVARSWAEERQRYPGWIVCPYGESKLLRFSDPKVEQSDTSAEANLRFSLERIWRYRIAGVWLNPQDMTNADTHFESAAHTLSIAEQTELCVSVASEWRHHQKWDEWERWMARLKAIESDEAALHHAYESAHRALMNWDDDEALKAVTKLDSDEPIWMMRRAGLSAMLFRNREAAELYQASLLRIRQKLLSAPKSAWLISLEGWASLFHRVFYSALGDDFNSFHPGESDETRMRYFEAKADPLVTIRRIEKLASDRIDRNQKEEQQWKASFQSGRYGPADTRINFDDECPFYSLLELMERTGAPERLFCSNMEAAFRAVGNFDENALLNFFARYRTGEIKILDWAMSRMQVARMSGTAVEFFTSVIPQRIGWLRKLPDNGETGKYQNFLLEFLARIVVRTSSKQALDVFEWATKLLESSTVGRYHSSCGKVLKNAVEAMKAEERHQAMDLALHIKTPGEAGACGSERDWPELFEGFPVGDARKLSISPRSAARINTLIDLVDSGSERDRAIALIRLHVLYQANKLTKVQSNSLESAIWARCDPSGWPCHAGLLPWVFHELPGEVRANARFLENIVGEVANGQIEHRLLVNLREGLETLGAIVSKELLVSCVKSCLAWTPSPATEAGQIARALSGSDLRDKATVREIGQVLAKSLLPRLNAEDLTTGIRDTLTQAERLPRIPSLVATAFQVTRLWPSYRSTALAQIRSAIASRDPARVRPAFIAVEQFIQNDSPNSDVPPEIKELLLHACEHRTQPGLGSTLELLGDMTKKGQLSSEDLDRLSSALPVVMEEYHYDQRNLEVLSVVELPGVRRGVHRLVKLLVGRNVALQALNKELGNDPLPEVRFWERAE